MKIRLEDNAPVDEDGYILFPKSFISGTWLFEEVTKKGNICIYRKKQENWKDCYTYEVYILRKFESYEIAENFIPKKISIVGDKLWGDGAWSFQDLKSAQKKFNELIEKNP